MAEVDPGSDELLRWFACERFLVEEAACLDDDRFDDWLALLTSDVTYEVPIHVTRRRGEPTAVPGGWHMKEDRGSLSTRIARLATSTAWGEDPPSRTKRLVANVRCGDWDAAGEITAASNLLVLRTRGDHPDHVLLGAERHDRLRRVDGRLLLAARTVHLTHTTLPVQSISIFL